LSECPSGRFGRSLLILSSAFFIQRVTRPFHLLVQMDHLSKPPSSFTHFDFSGSVKSKLL